MRLIRRRTPPPPPVGIIMNDPSLKGWTMPFHIPHPKLFPCYLALAAVDDTNYCDQLSSGGIGHRGTLCLSVACEENSCSWNRCCICQTEMQNAHHAQLLHMRDKDLLLQLFSCVGQRCSIYNRCMCGTEFY